MHTHLLCPQWIEHGGQSQSVSLLNSLSHETCVRTLGTYEVCIGSRVSAGSCVSGARPPREAWAVKAHLHLQADELEALPLNAANHLSNL